MVLNVPNGYNIDYCLYFKIRLCQNRLWMVGVDRGNPPAKGGTTLSSSRMAGDDRMALWLSVSHKLKQITQSLYKPHTSVWPASRVRLLMFRMDLWHHWSHARDGRFYVISLTRQSGRPREPWTTARREDGRSVINCMKLTLAEWKPTYTVAYIPQLASKLYKPYPGCVLSPDPIAALSWQ